MNNEINLLYSKKQLRLSQLVTKVRIMRFISLGLLFFICGLSIVFFLFVIASPLSSLKAQEKALLQDLSGSRDKIFKQTLLVTRLNDIDTITNKRSQFDGVLKTLTDTLPSGVRIDDFAAEKKVVELGLSSQSLDDIETSFSTLKAMVKSKNTFSQVFMSSLSSNEDNDGNTTSFSTKLIILLL